jgi:hypothetical protein
MAGSPRSRFFRFVYFRPKAKASRLAGSGDTLGVGDDIHRWAAANALISFEAWIIACNAFGAHHFNG